ncbi:MAG: ABC-type transport auxiliary lipoprotein family protein [Gammaproteobacteria bacterium]
MRKYVIMTISMLASAALLGGCGLLSRPKTPPVNQYQIAPKVAGGKASATCALVIQVRGVAASTPWATDNMLYTQTTHSLASYAYHQWAAEPSTMLTDAIVGALAARGLYRGVLGPASPGDSDLTLAVTLTRGPLQIFHGQTGTKDSGSAASQETLALAANLTEAESGKLIASKEFTAEQSAAPNAYGGVLATNAIAGKLINQMLDWLGQANAGIKGCTPK